MLIEDDILKFESFVIDVSKRAVIINSCKIITKLYIKQRDFFVRRNIFFNHRIIVSLDTQIRVSFDFNISENKGFIFEFFIKSIYIMFYYLMNLYISEIIVRNDSSKFVIISTKIRLNSILKLLYDYCF